MAGAFPGVVGQQHVAILQRLERKDAQEVLDGFGHGVDVPWRAGDGLRDHAAVRQEYAGGQIAGFARGGAKGGPDQHLRLFFHDRQQAVPCQLKTDVLQRCGLGGGGRHRVGCEVHDGLSLLAALAWRRWAAWVSSSTSEPRRLRRAT
ncbi:hypothetical protein D3C73_857720 [compost metagenome]